MYCIKKAIGGVSRFHNKVFCNLHSPMQKSGNQPLYRIRKPYTSSASRFLANFILTSKWRFVRFDVLPRAKSDGILPPQNADRKMLWAYPT